MRIRRIASSMTLLVAISGLIAGGVPHLRAQEPVVSLSLLAQTPWTSPDAPGLDVAIAATNTGSQVLDALSLAYVIGPSIISRVEYEIAITSGPATAAAVIDIALPGKLEPGASRTLTTTIDVLDVPAITPDDSRVYPIRLELRSHDVPIASMHTAIIHIVRQPEAPLRLSWWAELTWPTAFGPDERLRDPSLEAAIAPGGTLSSAVASLAGSFRDPATAGPVDLVVQPSLIDQIDRMRDGYVTAAGIEVGPDAAGPLAAQGWIDALATLAARPEVQVSAMPFSAPSIPALLASGLAGDLDRQRAAGRVVVERVLGVTPALAVTRPPGGALDDAALIRLVGSGAAAVLADADTVARPPTGELGFAPAPVATVATTAGVVASLVLPDPSTQALLERTDLLADPVRAAQLALGELAVIWKEEPNPSPPAVRGIAVALAPTAPPTLWQPLVARLTGAPFLEPLHAQDLVAVLEPAPIATTLLEPDLGVFTESFAETIRARQRDIGAYESMLVVESDLPVRLRRDLMVAEGAEHLGVGEGAGREWLDHVADVTGAAFAGTTPTVSQVFTFTSGEGTIPLLMGDPGPIPLRVVVELASAQFTFPDGDRQEIVLAEPNQVVSFRVSAKAAGQNAIQVNVLAPSGRRISEQTVTVRSTAVNTIALTVTGTAALVLLVLYSRRWWRRRPTT